MLLAPVQARSRLGRDAHRAGSALCSRCSRAPSPCSPLPRCMSGRCCSSASACSSGCSTAATRGHARLGTRLRCATLIGFWFGFGYFLTGLYWIAEAFLVEPWRHGWLIPFVMTALPAAWRLFFAAAAALAMMLWRPGAARVFALAIAFGLAEYARGHVLTGLPWNLVGYGLAATLPMMQAAAIFGVYALEPPCASTVRQPLRHLVRRKALASARPSSTALRRSASSRCALASGAMWGAARLAERRCRPPPACGSASSRPMSIRPTNGARRTAPRSSTPISISPSPAAALKGSTASRSWSGRRRRFPSSSPTPLEALHAIGDVLPEGTSLLVGSARVVEERDAARIVLPPSASITACSWSATRVRSSAATTRSISCRSANIFRFRISWRASALAAHRRARRLQRRHRASPALDPGRAAGAAAHLLRDHFSRRGRRQFADGRAGSQRHQRCLVRHQRWSLSALPSSTTSRRRARLAGGPRRQHRHLGDHRSLRTRPRRARSRSKKESSTGSCPRLRRLRIRNVGTLDRNRGSRHLRFSAGSHFSSVR